MACEEIALKAASSGLGLGYLPVAPGTWASAGAAALYVALRRLPAATCYPLLGGLFVATLVLGVAIGRSAERVYGRKDPAQFVLDELAGQWLTCLLFWWRGPLWTAAAAFVAFRVFDIAKPYPVNRLEKLPGGWGVMADDLAAALYSAGALWLVSRLLVDPLMS